MAQLLVVTPDASDPAAPVSLPGLALLAHTMRICLPDADALTAASRVDAVVIDARTDLAAARTVCRLFVAAGNSVPLLLVLSEGGFVAIRPDWGVDDIVCDTAGPAEFEARLRLLLERTEESSVLATGPLTIDENGYHAAVNGRPLDLTYTEFELLKYLAQHPGRVFSREQLLSDVWGYDYYGGTRTVDVHVRRLRAKLGVEFESLIGTVRNVGYRFSPEGIPRADERGHRRADELLSLIHI